MQGFDLLVQNILSPIVLAFALGFLARLIRSELELPENVLKALSIYLLLSIGLKGGHELRQVTFADVAGPLGAAGLLVILLPILAYVLARVFGKFDIANAAAIAAHYGSVSTVTFFASLSFAAAANTPAEGFMPALIAILEWAIIVALFIARFNLAKQHTGGKVSLGGLIGEAIRGRGIVLLGGGMLIGYAIGDKGYGQIAPFYDDLFRGMLMLFILEMGMAAARQLAEFKKVGWFMLGYGTLVPLLFGTIGVTMGTLAGLSTGGAFVLGAVAASSSYIDAPAAVRAALPSANPSIYLTASLGITFPFNLIVGLPLYYKLAVFLH